MKQAPVFGKEIYPLIENSIVLKTENFIFIDKPAGFTATPTRMGVSDPRPCAGKILQEILKIQIYPVHRLDCEVTGLMMFALNKEAHRISNSWFEKRSVQKKYLALSSVLPTKIQLNEKIVWRDKIKRGKKRAYLAPTGDMAETEAQFIEITNFEKIKVSRWELVPHTGRSHQLRFHMYKAEMPILGDTLYGSTETYRPNEIALRAFELNFLNCDNRLDLPEVVQI